MAFITDEDIMRVIEGLIVSVCKEKERVRSIVPQNVQNYTSKCKLKAHFFQIWDEVGVKIHTPLQRMSYRDAINNYGVDKPDTRFPFLLTDVTDCMLQVRHELIFFQALKERLLVFSSRRKEALTST